MDGNLVPLHEGHRSQEDIRIVDDDLCEPDLNTDGIGSEGIIIQNQQSTFSPPDVMRTLE